MGELHVYVDDQGLTSIAGGLIRDIPRVGNDVRRLRLTGTFAPWQQFSGNFAESRIHDAEFRNIDLDRCDWKDCRVTDVVFDNCDLGHASFITNSFERCEFIECRFPDTGISDCVFKECVFDRCDLKHIIIKSSHLEKSSFFSCETSNRVIESSLLIDTAWASMDIDARLIFGNFGLLKSEFQHCSLVTRTSMGEDVKCEWSALGEIASESELSPVEYLRYRNFETENLEADEGAFESALDLRNWKSDVAVQASFGAQLSSFAQFLVALFERDRLPVYPLLILHSRNFEILKFLEQRPEAAGLYQEVAGIHWVLARHATAFLEAVENWSAAFAETKILHVAAVGPLDEDYFRNWFAEVGINGIEVESVRPRNSPIDLALGFVNHKALVGFVAAFLSTRFKVSLSKTPRLGEEGGAKVKVSNDVFAISMGLMPSKSGEYQLSVKTLLPNSFLLGLQLSMSVAFFQKVRRVLVDLLSSEQDAQKGIHKH
ncbi:pentapeptide repeat-containing protein [Dyella sp. A6]|uniref:pentapeptide repeat-containing protein n=1 Tax=Dyella aluminiiresistens TaxID=3069105 RepID=UPI002E783F53|nr:pentapeptide repeat-containing protein [Dyella sp. A6]